MNTMVQYYEELRKALPLLYTHTILTTVTRHDSAFTRFITNSRAGSEIDILLNQALWVGFTNLNTCSYHTSIVLAFTRLSLHWVHIHFFLLFFFLHLFLFGSLHHELAKQVKTSDSAGASIKGNSTALKWQSVQSASPNAYNLKHYMQQGTTESPQDAVQIELTKCIPGGYQTNWIKLPAYVTDKLDSKCQPWPHFNHIW